MATILLVSKPVEPPWNDSSKNLVRDLVLGMRRHDAIAFGRKGGDRELGRARLEPLHPQAGTGRFAPASSDHLRVLGRLAFGRRGELWHFFFAPNPKTSTIARAACRARRVRSVQTVCSVPRDDVDPGRVLFADRVVVLSRFTADRFARAGLAPERIVRIPPAAPPLVPLAPDRREKTRRRLGVDEDTPLVLYPGDLEFGNGARLTVEAHARLPKETRLVLACRAKTPRARAIDAELRELTVRLGTSERVQFLGETSQILDVVGAADIVTLPSDVPYAKMDYPLVLLEAMALARPVVVATGTPAAELAEGGAARAVAPDVDTLADAISTLVADRAHREALGGLARETALAEHDRTRMAAAYEALYDSLVGD
jgi:phosphatidylinositol alpha-1,6-mannosyltransferase